MQETSRTIHAKIGQGILTKADRLFRNDDQGTFVELLQNSRRATATRIDVCIEEVSAMRCLVEIQDDGSGISDFERLLTLGESGWNEDLKATEDPAGMGFYSLCLSGVEVYSGHQYAKISPEAFVGTEDAVVEVRESCVGGTRLRFSRSSSKESLAAALERAALFYPLEVCLNGDVLPRYDFLEGAIHREVIDGIEVGFATEFKRDWSYYGDDNNWNFYGARIREVFANFAGILMEDGQSTTLYARFNVLETGRIKLQLPDRRNIIHNDFLQDFFKKARAAAFRCFQKQQRHVLSFRDWKEARELGIDLPEAECLLTTWQALAADIDSHQMFGENTTRTVSDLNRVMLVDDLVTNVHTLQGALHSGATLDYVLYRESPGYEGYTWYNNLPRLVDVEVTIQEGPEAELLPAEDVRPCKIDLALTVQQQGLENRIIVIPAYVHVESEELNSVSFVAVKNSPWDNDQLAGPFPIEEFLIYATFSASDEGDLFETQLDWYRREVEQAVNEYFRGPRASLVALVEDGLKFNARTLALQLNVSQIRLTRNPTDEHKWEVELVGAQGQLL
jgi:hypothetical protein